MTLIERKNGYYHVGGVYVPSVTTVLSSWGSCDGLLGWAAGVGAAGCSGDTVDARKETGEQAFAAERFRTGQIGTAVHTAVECYLTGQPQPEPRPDARALVDAMLTWIATHRWHPTALEFTVSSEIPPYAGRADLLTNWTADDCRALLPSLVRTSEAPQPGLTLVDFKTGTTMNRAQIRKHTMQLAAYMEAGSLDLVQACLVHIPRNRPEKITARILPRATLDHAYHHGFLPAYDVWLYADAPLWYHAQWHQQPKGTVYGMEELTPPRHRD